MLKAYIATSAVDSHHIKMFLSFPEYHSRPRNSLSVCKQLSIFAPFKKVSLLLETWPHYLADEYIGNWNEEEGRELIVGKLSSWPPIGRI